MKPLRSFDPGGSSCCCCELLLLLRAKSPPPSAIQVVASCSSKALLPRSFVGCLRFQPSRRHKSSMTSAGSSTDSRVVFVPSTPANELCLVATPTSVVDLSSSEGTIVKVT